MTFPKIEKARTHVFRYPVASSDMFFCEAQQRDVFIGRDDEGQVRIWGELVDQGAASKVELCRVFLEYALYCNCAFSDAQAAEQMAQFGQRIGRRLAAYLRHRRGLLGSKNVALGALECLFGNIRAGYFEDYAPSGVRFVVTDCPLEDAARRCGIPYVELARHGINAMCQSVCTGMNPKAVVKTLPDNRPEFMFTISLPVAV